VVVVVIMVMVMVALHCGLVVIVTAKANGGVHGGKRRDVAVQHEAPEFLHVWILICQVLLFSGSKGRIFLESRHIECVLHNFRAIGGAGPFEDPIFVFLTVRIIFE
jgi:hypothetical protein